MRVMIVVTHLLGSGHLRRALTLAKAFQAAGDTVRLISGGAPIAGLEVGDIPLVQLPPVTSNGADFSVLLAPDGSVVDAPYLERRRSALVSALGDWPPDVLITELFPFGRRILSEEFLALLDAAQAQTPRPLILTSIRDILAPPSKPKRAERTRALLSTYFDAVLVHSDACAVPLSLSWPVTPAVEALLHYTGFVAPAAPEPHPEAAGEGEVLVSAGGGAVGDQLFDAAIEAARHDPDHCWRLFVGGQDAARKVTALRGTAPQNAMIGPTRPDFRQMLNHAACSVSFAGYNTAMDLLQTGCPAVLVPFDAGVEVEQGLRAQSLGEVAGFHILKSRDLTGASLADSVTQMLAQPRRPRASIAMDGAAETVRITHRLREGQA